MKKSIKELHVLVLGVGSIGERHIRNLWLLGVTKITAYRTRNLPFRDIGSAQVSVVSDLKQINTDTIDCAIICSPTHLHFDQSAWCADSGIHAFIEKPLSHHLDSLTNLTRTVSEKKLVFFVGYMMRFHPVMISLKKMISSEILGKVIYIESEWREYLPDWHPWEDYKKGYAARSDMGGGAALTLSHDLDLICWLLNRNPQSWQSNKVISPTLETTAETIADYIVTFPDQILGRVHLNMAAPIPQRKTEVIFEKGRITVEYFENKLIIEEKSKEKKIIIASEFERNQMYVSELEYFLSNVCSGNHVDSIPELEQAILITKIALT